MSIDRSILDVASAAGLRTISTGGGCDYVHRHLPDGQEVIMTAATHDGSPAGLAAPANLVIFDDNDWRTGVTIPFLDADTALEAMALITGLEDTP